MDAKDKNLLMRLLFGVWVLIAGYVVLRSGRVLGTSPVAGVILLAVAGGYGAAAALMFGELRHGREPGYGAKFFMGGLSLIILMGMGIMRLSLEWNPFTMIAPFPNQTNSVMIGLLITAIYCLWNNPMAQPISFKEMRALDREEYDPTAIDRDFNERVFRNRVLTGGNRR